MPTQRLLPLALIFLFFAVSCASVKSHPLEPTPGSGSTSPSSALPKAPVPGAPVPPRSARTAVEDERVQKIIDAMQDLYNSGLEAHKAGRYDEARDYFDQAVDTALSGEPEIDTHPDLKSAYEELLENIDSLEGDLYQGGQPRGEEAPKDELKDITSYLSPEEAEKEREKIQSVATAVQYDLPVDLNDKVLTFIEAFQTRMRGPFEAGLRRSGRYLPMMKRIFAEAGLPTDLVYMAHQESAFKTSAYSRAKAKGLWQFIAPTARKYGLKRDEWVDERSDPEKATRAAAAYLKDLYAMFGDWYLAMAAYNAGEGKILRSLSRTAAGDFWALAQHRRILRTETKNYVPAILASMIIDKAPHEYGFHLDPLEETSFDRVSLDSPTDLTVLADCAGTTLEEIRDLNPELRGMATPPYGGGYSLRIPFGTADQFTQKYAAVPKEQRLKWTQHEVRRGETLGIVARKYGVSVSAILQANSLRGSHRLRPGQVLAIPLSGGAIPAKVSRRQLDEDAPTYDRGEKVVYRVRRGDSLQKIALRYHTTIASVRSWNGISGSSIRPGQRLTLYYQTVAGSGGGDTDEAPTAALAVNGEYRVKRGDTLFSIAQRFGMTVEKLRSVNNLGRSSVIKPGDRLRVVAREESESSVSRPAGPSSTKGIRYRVRPGDTLEDIATRHGVAVSDLIRWNHLDSPDQIPVGATLQVQRD
ncbi:MAG: hypothetical protein DMH00_11085 [Acidobacteria bacterium]|nr:MAG: hypothetical protein DMH00_11085 [Acidobacteriota bacterium]